jgi:cation diffusion facilitator family transporter
LLILIAAGLIVYSAVERWLNPAPLEQLNVGLAISAVAAGINWAVARVLIRAGKTHRSASLAGEGQHLMTDVWTSVGVVAGVGLVWLTGLPWLDSLVALLAAGQIGWSGFRLVREAGLGLMDTALPAAELAEIVAVLEKYTAAKGIRYHALRTRQAGAHRFVSVHLQMPGAWTVQEGHTLAEQIEADMRAAVPAISVFTHMEPLEDPRSWADIEL